MTVLTCLQYNPHIATHRFVQGSRLLYVQQLTALKALLLSGGPNLTGNAPVTALAACLPPDLETLHLMHDELPEVGQHPMLCVVLQGGGVRLCCHCIVASVQDVAWQLLHARSHKGQQTADVLAVARLLTGFSDVQDIYYLTEDRPVTADVLSDAVLQSFASPLLGPCQVQYLDLTAQRGINMGIAALASGRFPGWNHDSFLCMPLLPHASIAPFFCMFLLPHAESPRL